jgi:DNA-binding NtrC family response regulator
VEAFEVDDIVAAQPASVQGQAPRLDLQGSLADATRRAVADVERYKIAEALREAGGDKARAAELLQVSFKTLLAKLKESGLDS